MPAKFPWIADSRTGTVPEIIGRTGKVARGSPDRVELGLRRSSKIPKETKAKAINVPILTKFANWSNGMRPARIEITIVTVNMAFLGRGAYRFYLRNVGASRY